MFGRSVCQLLADQVTHTTCFSCVLIRRVSQLTKPPSSSRNFVQFLCQPVPALDDQVRTLQQDLRTQPSLQRSRFSCVPLRAHRGFLSSTRGGSVGWSCAAMPGCDCHSKHPAGCALNRSSHCVNMEASFGQQIERDGFDRRYSSCGKRGSFHRLLTYWFLSLPSRASVPFGSGLLLILSFTGQACTGLQHLL